MGLARAAGSQRARVCNSSLKFVRPLQPVILATAAPSIPRSLPPRAHRSAAIARHAAPELPIFERPEVRGKFLFVGDRKFWVKGVTYGTFRPDTEGFQFPAPRRVESDFAQMAAAGFNTVRVYTPPPRWLLDAAHAHGLKVMVGLPWAQHVTFLDEKGLADTIVRQLRADVRSCANHPALLCFSVGNEIPASIVRWTGPRRVEQFIRRLYDVVKIEDPGALVTYVNFPTTEFLRLPFLDFFCFNVYLESREPLEAYLNRLQNLAGEKPLLMAEIGLDSRRNGEEQQASSLDWQVRTAFAAGCTGALVFAWTDEWYRGGHDIDDWDFGLTTRDRQPKRALAVASRAFGEVPFPTDTAWPRVSVVVCTHNGARTIRDTLEAFTHLEYPDFEVIVVDDGSTDTVPQIVAEYNVRLISTANCGLSAARNTGWQEATGEIVAYIDDDAYPDPHWLHYIAYRFLQGDWVGVGGPNIAPPGDGWIAECVANAPGGPVHVLVSDIEAEHIPGCNMAFRREALAAIDGFDVRYRAAGDDVDLCWRLEERGGKIGFHAGAMNWHHRRNSVRTYWRQQKGYGKAEALLEEKWPERYNSAGHLQWTGRLYGKGFTEALPLMRSRIYQGTWGTAAYQSVYQPQAGTLLSLPLMPEWYLVVGVLAALTLLGLLWPPLMYAVAPFALLAAAAPVAQAVLSAKRASFPGGARSAAPWQKRVLTAIMHLMQPAARLIGRYRHGLFPWRRRGHSRLLVLRSAQETVWSEQWRAPEAWVERVEAAMQAEGAVVRRGGDFDHWDLLVRGGLLGAAVGEIAVEEHGGGRQLIRIRSRGVVPTLVLIVYGFLTSLAIWAAADGAVGASIVLCVITGLFGLGTLTDTSLSAGTWGRAVDAVRRESVRSLTAPP